MNSMPERQTKPQVPCFSPAAKSVVLLLRTRRLVSPITIFSLLSDYLGEMTTTTTLGVASLLLHHDISMIASSDSQLAICSQVCKTWRRSAIDGIVQCAMKGILLAVAGDTTEKVREEGRDERGLRTKNNPAQNLLLIEMAKMMVLHCIQNNRMNDSGNDIVNVNSHDKNGHGPCCLAWFEPSGIQTIEIHVANRCRDEEEGKSSKYHKIAKECCHEWRGYRTPCEVLGPFGYDDKFVSVSFLFLQYHLYIECSYLSTSGKLMKSSCLMVALSYFSVIVAGSIHCHSTRSHQKRTAFEI